MKDKLLAIYNLLNQVSVKGAENIVPMYKALAILDNTISELEEEERTKQKGE